MNEIFDSILNVVTTDASFTAHNLLLAMGVALLLGLLLAGVYLKTQGGKTPSQGFALTLVILPAIITVIIMLVGNSVARAFSLAGAFQIVRFRSAPGDPKNIAYVVFCMAVGLACGMGYVLYGVIVAVVMCVVMILLEVFKFATPKDSQRLLKITVPESLDYQGAFDDILKRHTNSYKLSRVKTADLGSLYQLQYAITAVDGMDEKRFIDELRTRNGNLNITLVLDAAQGEF
ncbi:hypothetical protein FACS1894217_02400 [Clostridia bacterium]|nr:hypothetical protein FACS1894217_02400 [Clostridia bacterium]